MPQILIPKLARNKYNYVNGTEGNIYVTQSQLMMAASNGSGGGGGNNNWTTQEMYKIEQMLSDRGVVTSDDLKTINGYSLIGTGDITVGSEGVIDLSAYMTKQEMTSYVSKTELDNASYLNQSYLNDKMSNYPTFSNIDAILSSYATKSFVLDRCSEVETASYNYANSIKIDCYSYTDSKTKTSDIEAIVNQVIAAKLLSGDLISAAAVEQKIQESRV